MVDFTASWCGPCHVITPVLVELAKKLPDVIFLKVDVDVDELTIGSLKTLLNSTEAQDFGVEAMPTFIFMKDGTIVDKVVDARNDELQQKITLHMQKA
ncbi:hypothetical protein CRYUN_Cryun27aG0101200 [Craigia yunnanensis]